MSKVKLTKISINGGTQPRVDIDEELVAEYAADMQEGDDFPPIILFHDGAKHWLADGFHRYHASKKAGFKDIHADVKSGTKRDAILYSVSANGKHGKRRTNADKSKAVKTLLNDTEWSQWSDREIARQCEVSTPTVSKYRKTTVKVLQSNSRKGADGRTIDTSNIGKDKNGTTNTSSHKTYFKDNKRKRNTPRMGEYNSSDEDKCPMCGQTWPEHQQNNKQN